MSLRYIIKMVDFMINYLFNAKNTLCSVLWPSSRRKNISIFLLLAVFGLALTACSTTDGMDDYDYGDNTTDVYVRTLAGTTSGYVDGPATSSKFNQPFGVAVDKAGNVYVADMYNHRIRKIDKAGRVSTLAGGGPAGYSGEASGQARHVDARGTSAMFNFPHDVTVDNAGNVYVADAYNHRIRKIDTIGNVTTLAGDGNSGYVDGRGTSARFNFPRGLAVDNAGNVYVADQNNDRIRKIDRAGNVSTLAGGSRGFADGVAASAMFNQPYSVAVDGTGNVYVADTRNHRIRKIDRTGNVSTLAGNGVFGFADGAASSAMFYWPESITVDNTGTVYVADTRNHRIREIDKTGYVSTLTGGTRGLAGGHKNSARFNYPRGIAVDNAGAVYVADADNHRVRKITDGSYGEQAVEKKDDTAASKVKLGELIGVIGGFEGADIIVNGRDTIGRQAPVGRALIVDANGQYIFLQSTFPMQTVVKCRVTSGDRAQIKKGMNVYLKP